MTKTWSTLVVLLFLCATYAYAQQPTLYIPFPEGQSWKVTRAYNIQSHQLYSSYDDRYALDFALSECADWDQPVTAAMSGIVRIKETVMTDRGWGNHIAIEQYGYRTRYSHLNRILVSNGDSVVQGQVIGTVGNTGYTEGSVCPEHSGKHLHFALDRKHQENLNGEYTAIKPEPLSGYIGLVADQWYTSNNEPLIVGMHADGWHNIDNGDTSFPVYRSYHHNAITGGKLCSNPNDNGGGVYLHQWGQYAGLLVQDFNGCGGLLNGAIITREGSGRAYTVRGGFWNVYAGNDYGPQNCGAPVSEEGGDTINGVRVIQKFENCILYWDPIKFGTDEVYSSLSQANPNFPPEVPSEYALADSGIFQIAAANTYPQGGEYSGVVEGSTFKLALTTINHSQISFSLVNGPGLVYDELRVERNGIVVAYLSGNATAMTDSTVLPTTTYTYQVRGYLDGLGEVVYSQKLTVETPSTPGTFLVSGTARDSDTVDITLVDTLHTSAIAHRIYRDGEVIAATTGYQYADYFLTPSTTYSYQLEAITVSGISLGFSPAIQITTNDPDGTEQVPPAQGAPVNPSVPLRLVQGVTVLEPISPVPHVISTCSRIAFVLENVGSTSVFIDRVEAEATVVLDDGWGTVKRKFSPDIYQYPTLPLEIVPGERYEYEGDNCWGNNAWPGLPGTATIVPMIKLYTIAGLTTIADIDASAGYSNFSILPSYTNPDFKVVDIRLTPSDPHEGDAIAVELDIKNIGDAFAGTFITEVTLSDGTVYSAVSPQIAPQETVTTTIPIGVFVQSFNEIQYRLDRDDAHFEWDETDNNGLFYFGVRPKPFQCSDSIDNDNDGKIDWADGINQNPDPQCSGPTDNREKSEGPSCGIGFEIAPFMIICAWFVSRKKLVWK